MSLFIIKLNAFLKGVILWMRPHLYLGFLERPFSFMASLLSLSRWAASQERRGIPNDFFTPGRDYSRRLNLYRHVSEQFGLDRERIVYLEFGVFEGHSFRWWLGQNTHPESRFYGFDTFEGLPENWGMFFGKGTLLANVPDVHDPRAQFIKGLFQDTLPGFIKAAGLDAPVRKVIHLDADLFSSTLFALASLHPWLQKGDILLFDEFNVPEHEYKAMKIMSEAFYFKPRLIGAVNNYYQSAFVVE